MEKAVAALFERYARFFNRALTGDVGVDEAATFYAPAFIAASPAGVMTGANDDQFLQHLAAGYERYRAIGTSTMALRALRLSPIDTHHCVAHTDWTATYTRPDGPDVSIEFEVHYLVQLLAGEPRIFGWISGDEQALLQQHGIG